jgi:hypothetical protein
MTIDEFWGYIDTSRHDDSDAQSERLVARLAGLPREDIVDFCFWWGRMHADAYRIDLWAAAYYVNGGCSDDGFDDFRNWLLLQGQAVFSAAVADPNTLADVCAGGTADGEFMSEGVPGWRAWDLAFGGADADAVFNALYRARHPEDPPAPNLGERWDFDDPGLIRQRLPRFYHSDQRHAEPGAAADGGGM